MVLSRCQDRDCTGAKYVSSDTLNVQLISWYIMRQPKH